MSILKIPLRSYSYSVGLSLYKTGSGTKDLEWVGGNGMHSSVWEARDPLPFAGRICSMEGSLSIIS